MYARALYKADGATLDDFREAVTTIEDTARIARRVLGGVHPVTVDMEEALRDARAALELVLARLSIAFAALGSSRTVARETPSSGEI